MYFITRNGKPAQCKDKLSKAKKCARRKCATSGGLVQVLSDDRKFVLATYGFDGKVPRKFD